MNLTLIGAKPLAKRVLQYLLTLNSELTVTSLLTVAVESELQAFAAANGLPVFQDAKDFQGSAEFGLIVGYPKILPDSFLSKFQKIFNVHFGILPFYRGSQTLSHAIINGDSEFGVSFHLVDTGIDTGPIYDIMKFPLPSHLTAAQMIPVVEDFAFESVKKNIIPALNQTLTPQPQTMRYPLYLRNSLDALLPLDPFQCPEDLERKIRALTLPGRPRPLVESPS